MTTSTIEDSADKCVGYDITPTISAVHPCSIYAATMTRNKKWMFTGGEDGFIRKYDFISSINADQMLTQNQRQGLVDTIVKAGVLVSVWENEEVTEGAPSPDTTSEPKISAVYSMDVHSEGVWMLTGCESGSIHLYTVRHDEGMCHHTFRKHQKAVSVIKISPDEYSFISGSWDKTIVHWDLNTGNILREYPTLASQITSLSLRPNPIPLSDLPCDTPISTESNPFSFLVTTFDGIIWVFDTRTATPIKKLLPTHCPPWAMSACWSIDGSKIYCGRRNGSVDEYDMEQGSLLRTIKMPRDSGPVSFVLSMPNQSHILCASHDNIRLWDLNCVEGTTASAIHTPKQPESQPATPGQSKSFQQTPTDTPKKSKLDVNDVDLLLPYVPFKIVPGHHGGMISCILMDEEGKYLMTTSGNRGWDGISTNNVLIYTITPKIC